MPRILLVDDEPLCRKVAYITLARLGYEVEIATNGLEAVEAVRRSHYDAILMDCHMPEMDGLQATQQIREWENVNGCHTTIIGFTCLNNRGECLQAGMDSYLLKTGSLEPLREEIQRWVPLPRNESISNTASR